MPTPSSPGPQPPYTISATCPEEQDTAQHHPSGWHARSDAYSSAHGVSGRAARHSSLDQDADTSSRRTRSPLDPQSLSSDGPTTDMAATSPSTADTQTRIDQHSMIMAETDDERTDSPCDATPSDSLHVSIPRHGVGTSTSSGPDMNVHNSSDLSHGDEDDYALPSMGHGFPSKRVSRTAWCGSAAD